PLPVAHGGVAVASAAAFRARHENDAVASARGRIARLAGARKAECVQPTRPGREKGFSCGAANRFERNQPVMATATQTSAPAGPENFAALFEESLARQEMRQGELITAEVTRVDYNVVVVNAGLKSESFIPIEEFKNDAGEVEVKPGDFVTVAIESIEDGYGTTRLSRDKAKRLKAWHDLEASMEQGSVVSGLVT